MMLKLTTFLRNFKINTSNIDIYDIKTGALLLSCRTACEYCLFDDYYYIERIESNNAGTLSIYVVYVDEE